jgi:hypothetical protein
MKPHRNTNTRFTRYKSLKFAARTTIIIIIIKTITYTSILPTLNNFKICLADKYSHTQELFTFTPVLKSTTTLAFGDMMTTARLK